MNGLGLDLRLELGLGVRYNSLKVKVKAVDLYSASSCMPKAGGQATSNALSSLTGVAGHRGHCPQPAHTGLGSNPTVGQTAPVRSRSPPS